MFTAEALKSLERDLVIQVTETNKEASQKALYDRARFERDRVLKGTPRPSSFRQAVNHVDGAALETVKWDGIVVFSWFYLKEVAIRAYEALVRNSPVYKGEYIERIRILINGEHSSLSAIDAATTEVQIVASADYARRLEVGLRPDGSKFVIQVPLHNVELVSRMLKKQFSDVASIWFNYVDLPDAWALKHDFPSRRRQQHETHVRHPAIFIALQGAIASSASR